MPDLDAVGQWITTHESLLSGLAAMVVLAGVIFSPGVRAIARLRERRRERATSPVAASVVQAAAPANPAPANSRSAGEPVLAVLAFDNLSEDPQLQFFSDGVSEEIMRRLSRGADLALVARATSFQFRGERKAEAAAQLPCTHVLDGSIRRAGTRVRIVAQLVNAANGTTVWSDSYDRDIANVFEVQDDISEHIARALNRALTNQPMALVTPEVYDRYLRTSPRSYAPAELRTHVDALEAITTSSPDFAPAWARLAYLRAWLNVYEPWSERPATVARIAREADRALAMDPENPDALTARLLALPPFGHFGETARWLDRLADAPGTGDGVRYLGWFQRNLGWVRASVAATERAFRLDALDPMTANLMALARMAAGQVEAAIPIYEDLLKRVPDMSFPVSSLLRCYAFIQDWPAFDRLLATTGDRQLREFEDGLAFLRTKREPSPANLDAWMRAIDERVARTGAVDVSRVVYTAHLGLVDDAYRLALELPLGPVGSGEDLLGPDAYRTALMFQAGMPELRNDPRFPRLCARVGLSRYWCETNRWPDCADELPYDLRSACREQQAEGDVWVYPR